jgi:hypothetical protein
MLTSPITVTIDGVAHNLSRVRDGDYNSTYLKKGTGFELQLDIRHSWEGKVSDQPQIERHNVELTRRTFNVDGSTTVTSTYTVIRSARGADVAAAVKDATGLNAFVTANATAIVSLES